MVFGILEVMTKVFQLDACKFFPGQRFDKRVPVIFLYVHHDRSSCVYFAILFKVHRKII